MPTASSASEQRRSPQPGEEADLLGTDPDAVGGRMVGMPRQRPPFVHGDLEVLQLLLRRRETGSVPGARGDGHRVALVLGGGGMRGSYTAGMLQGLERAGLRTGFDEVYGASSGAFSGAAFLTGSAAAGASCYPEDLASREFINMRRLGTGRPVLALDYLLDEVLGRRKRVPWQELCDSEVPLHVVATDTADLTAHTLNPTTVEAWQRAIRASASIPLLAGPPVEIAGRRWVDGSVSEPLAMARALQGGATHVLVMLCRGNDDLHPDPTAGLSWWANLLDRLVPGLGTLAQGSRRYRSELAMVNDATHPGRGAGHLLAIAPSRSAGVSGLCIEPDSLREAVEIGDSSTTSAIEYLAELDSPQIS